MEMSGQGWFTLAVLAVMIFGLVRFEYVADVIFLGALMILTLAGIITPKEALRGFNNEGMLTVAALFVVARGLVETGFMTRAANWVLPRGDNSAAALRRVMPVSAGLSAFMNNTTVVAMVMPALMEWARKHRVAPSRLLLPLSYAAIAGGVCTLIGTSTNLVVHGMMKTSDAPTLRTGFGMWELSVVGMPIAVLALIYLIYVCPRILPERKEFLEQLGETRREYLVEILVQPGSPLIGRTVQDAGLRGLPGLFLIEIERGAQLITPVGPTERLMANDRLVFTGVVSTIIDLQRMPGLVPAADSTFEVDPAQLRRRRLCEVVVSASSPLVGQNIREANFRGTYDAAVVAVHRNGRRVKQKIGDIRMEPGDTLLLQTGSDFANAHRNNPDFFLVSEVHGADPVRHERSSIAAAITIAMVAMMTLPDVLGWFPLPDRWPDWWPTVLRGEHPPVKWPALLDDMRVIFALLAAGLMVVTRCLSSSSARRSIEWNVLLVIAAAFGIGEAMQNSGAAKVIANVAIDLFQTHFGEIGLLAGVYLLTWLLTELMTNNAAAALMFPIAITAAQAAGLDPRPFAVTITIAASCGFIFPAGYQTHLMVFGPGGYRLGDFVKAGSVMVLLCGVMACTLIPIFWPLRP